MTEKDIWLDLASTHFLSMSFVLLHSWLATAEEPPGRNNLCHCPDLLSHVNPKLDKDSELNCDYFAFNCSKRLQPPDFNQVIYKFLCTFENWRVDGHPLRGYLTVNICSSCAYTPSACFNMTENSGGFKRFRKNRSAHGSLTNQNP
jgi:hypothetical protein